MSAPLIRVITIALLSAAAVPAFAKPSGHMARGGSSMGTYTGPSKTAYSPGVSMNGTMAGNPAMAGSPSGVSRSPAVAPYTVATSPAGASGSIAGAPYTAVAAPAGAYSASGAYAGGYAGGRGSYGNDNYSGTAPSYSCGLMALFGCR
jgi:hypothetical protein